MRTRRVCYTVRELFLKVVVFGANVARHIHIICFSADFHIRRWRYCRNQGWGNSSSHVTGCVFKYTWGNLVPFFLLSVCTTEENIYVVCFYSFTKKRAY